ncbi:MAG: methyl-accepting chemotaxis protein [Desulfobacteraceae bacterium]|nr:methyl-accepting chemotaxis protein [Desulfobacteraceae bacterium]
MSLKLKLIIFIFLFVLLPIVLLEGFQSWNHYKSQVEGIKKVMLEDMNMQEDVFIRFFDGVCLDMEFAAQVTEVNKLLTGFIDEDFDETEYWTDALTTVLVSFANNRKLFTDLLFTIDKETKSIVRVRYTDDRASQAENTALPEGFAEASAEERPTAIWSLSGENIILWLHYPVKNGKIRGMISGKVDLSRFYALCKDEEIYLFKGKDISVIDKGSFVPQGDSSENAVKLPENIAEHPEGIEDNRDNLFAYSRFALIKWMPEDIFTIWKIRTKSVVMEPVRSALIIKGIGIFIILLFLMICQILFLNNLILKPLRDLSDSAYKLADLDLSVSVEADRKDEIGRLLKDVKNMVESLREIISRVSETAVKVDSSASEISGTVTEQAAIAAQQFASVTEISATMEEFSTSSAQISDNSNSVVEIAANTLKSARQGARSVEIFMDKMNKIDEDNQNNIKEISGLRIKAGEITKVMGIINSIADQTKLIAFNAALEASSAGESGKRFGVVAAEIRRLADNVMESTSEIESRINDIQNAANYMVIASEASTKGIREGIESFSRTVGMLNEILSGAKSTTDAAEQISLSTRQQKTAADQVVIALKGIAQSSKQTSGSISYISLISNNLAELSADLQKLMKKFKLSEQNNITPKKEELS